MENSLKPLHLNIPVSEGSNLGPSISHWRGNASLLKASLKPQQRPTSGKEEEEEGRTESQKRYHMDAFDLRDWRENIKPPGDLSNIVRPNQLLPLCLECHAFTRMGNQQGAKIKPPFQGYAECRAASPKSPRFQVPRKRRRRGEKPIYSIESIPRTARTFTSNESTGSRLQMTSSSTSREWNLDEDRHTFCTPTPRRKRILKSQHDFKPLLGMKSLETLTADCPVSRNGLSFPGNALSAKKEPSLQDSDTDQSEYDELSSVLIYPSKEPAKKTEEGAWDEPKCPLIQPEKDEDQEKGGKLGGKNSPWIFSEMAKKEAAERVRSKIEELEDIIRQVSLNSSDQRRQKQSKCPFNIPIREEESLQNTLCQDPGPQLVEEFQALSEALSQSLRQVLKVEGAREEKILATSSESSQLNPLLYSDHCTSNWSSNASSNSHSARGETALDASEKTSASFEGTSPILLPLFSSSQQSPTGSLTHREGVNSDHHRGRINSVGSDLSPQWIGDCEAATADSGRTEKENRNRFCQGNLRQSEQDQAPVSRGINERDDLLSSGNSHSPWFTSRSVEQSRHEIRIPPQRLCYWYTHVEILHNVLPASTFRPLN